PIRLYMRRRFRRVKLSCTRLMRPQMKGKYITRGARLGVWAALVGSFFPNFPVAAQLNDGAAYTWTTLAGYPGIGSADGVGNAAQFNNPGSVAVDAAGNV